MLNDETVRVSKRILERLIDASEDVIKAHCEGTLVRGRDSVRIKNLQDLARTLSCQTGTSKIPVFETGRSFCYEFENWIRLEFWEDYHSKTVNRDQSFESSFNFFAGFPFPPIIAIAMRFPEHRVIRDHSDKRFKNSFEFFEYPGGKIGYYDDEAAIVYVSKRKISKTELIETLQTLTNN